MAQPNGMTHGEAYMLMRYENDAGDVVTIWNSRDGVTPFSTTIDGVEYRHRHGGRDRPARHHVPAVGDLIFIDCDHATWEAQEKAKIDAYWDHPTYPISKGYPTKEAALVVFMGEFQPGQPIKAMTTFELRHHFKARAHSHN